MQMNLPNLEELIIYNGELADLEELSKINLKTLNITSEKKSGLIEKKSFANLKKITALKDLTLKGEPNLDLKDIETLENVRIDLLYDDYMDKMVIQTSLDWD
jgi:hypothetical protein